MARKGLLRAARLHDRSPWRDALPRAGRPVVASGEYPGHLSGKAPRRFLRGPASVRRRAWATSRRSRSSSTRRRRATRPATWSPAASAAARKGSTSATARTGRGRSCKAWRTRRRATVATSGTTRRPARGSSSWSRAIGALRSITSHLQRPTARPTRAPCACRSWSSLRSRGARGDVARRRGRVHSNQLRRDREARRRRLRVERAAGARGAGRGQRR